LRLCLLLAKGFVFGSCFVFSALLAADTGSPDKATE
jgi:hypothetical protein